MQNLTDDIKKTDNNLTLPVLAVRGLVFFPGMMLQFDISRKKSVLAASEAIANDRLIFLVSQVPSKEAAVSLITRFMSKLVRDR